jgi:hypothetical protein
MATDLTTLQTANQELAEALAVMQHTVDELKMQQGLLLDAVVNIIQGRWDAAQFGHHSVEADVVALNPALQGKVNAVPFVQGR